MIVMNGILSPGFIRIAYVKVKFGILVKTTNCYKDSALIQQQKATVETETFLVLFRTENTNQL